MQRIDQYVSDQKKNNFFNEMFVFFLQNFMYRMDFL